MTTSNAASDKNVIKIITFGVSEEISERRVQQSTLLAPRALKHLIGSACACKLRINNSKFEAILFRNS